MHRNVLTIWLFILIGLAGCERAADISSPLKYESDEVSFQYPRNWKVDLDETQPESQSFLIDTPGDAVFIIQLYPHDNVVSLKEYIDLFVAQFTNDLPIGKLDESSFSPIGEEKIPPGLEGIEEQFSMILLGTEIPHIRSYYRTEVHGKVALFIAQSTTEDLHLVEPGFDLVLGSIKIGEKRGTVSPFGQ